MEGQPTKKELREIDRINRLQGSLSASLGRASEEEAEAICRGSLQTGIIKKFWKIPLGSALDKRGVDLVCETNAGYFLINVKKSAIGVETFKAERNKLFIVYPWRVTLSTYAHQRRDKETELRVILDMIPSFPLGGLPEHIRKELENPTYPKRPKTFRKPETKERIIIPESTFTLKNRLKSLKTSGIIKNLHMQKKMVWCITVSAIVDNLPVEIIKYGGCEQAEIEAYKEMLDKTGVKD